MSNVISFAAARLARQPTGNYRPATALPSPPSAVVTLAAGASGLAPIESLDVDFQDILRMSKQDEDDNFIDSLEDAIVFGGKAELQVRRIFWRFGLQRLPLTWGELMGNLTYCMLLNGWLEAFKPQYSAESRADAFEHHQAQVPGRGELLTMLANGDIASAWRWHQSHGTFDANACDADLTAVED